MKKFSALLLFTLLAITSPLACYGSDSPGSEKVVELKFGHVVQPSHPVHQSVAFFSDKVSEYSKGRIKIKIFPARQLGDDISLFQQVQQGSLDMACPSAAPLASFTKIATAFQMPFLGNDFDLNAKLYTSDEFQTLLSGFNEVGVKAFGALQGGMRHLVGSKGFLKSLADLKGVKIRVAETPLLVDLFSALGASPTPMPYGEIYTGLQNKIINAVEMDIPALLVEKQYEVAKYVTLDAHYVWPMIMMMSVNKWNSFSPNDQEIFKKAYFDTIKFDCENLKARNNEAKATLSTKGVQFYEPTKKEVAAYNDAVAGVVKKYCAADKRVAAFVEYAKRVKAGK